jgi:hypothetical protein
MGPDELTLIKKHFGEDVWLERMLFGGVRIITQSGEVDFKNHKFEYIVGGSDMYRSVLLCSHEMSGGPITVSGHAEHILAAMAHGKELGVKVNPEGVKEGSGCVALGFAMVAFWVGLVGGGIFRFVTRADDFEPLESGFVAAAIVGVIAYLGFNKVFARAARRGGQQYRDIFPEIPGSERRAARDVARERGLLEADGPTSHHSDEEAGSERRAAHDAARDRGLL